MKKKITDIYGGINSKVGDLLVNRLIPGLKIGAVGPIVFLDHVYPKEIPADGNSVPTGEFAHPHRGIATFSYVFSGSLSHFDSKGNRDTISAGGVQWMKAGNGIIHDEQPFADNFNGRVFHSLQFWVNLPSKIKSEEPEYKSLQSDEIPEIGLPDNGGILRVLLGEFGSSHSPIKTFSNEFVYHIRLNPKSKFSIQGRTGLEYAAFIPGAEVAINDKILGKSKIVIFDSAEEEMMFENPNIMLVDILVFGGRPYTEAIVGEGPFVMNSRAEIAEAYRDFFDGKYGTITYTST